MWYGDDVRTKDQDEAMDPVLSHVVFIDQFNHRHWLSYVSVVTYINVSPHLHLPTPDTNFYPVTESDVKLHPGST